MCNLATAKLFITFCIYVRKTKKEKKKIVYSEPLCNSSFFSDMAVRFRERIFPILNECVNHNYHMQIELDGVIVATLVKDKLIFNNEKTLKQSRKRDAVVLFKLAFENYMIDEKRKNKKNKKYPQP